MFIVVQHVTEVNQIEKDGEVTGAVIVLGGRREGFTCLADRDALSMLPSVGQRVRVTARRNSWNSGSRDAPVWRENFKYQGYEPA